MKKDLLQGVCEAIIGELVIGTENITNQHPDCFRTREFFVLKESREGFKLEDLHAWDFVTACSVRIQGNYTAK